MLVLVLVLVVLVVLVMLVIMLLYSNHSLMKMKDERPCFEHD